MQNTATVIDWDEIYRQGTPPWDNGRPSAELLRVVADRKIKPCTVLDIGCGTGADAIYLARKRFEVTAVDLSPIAIERARVRAEQHDALIRFVHADIFRFGPTAGAFDLVYDAGFYHFIRRTALDQYLDLLWRVTRPGSYCLALCGALGEACEGGPPQVDEDTIYNELGRLFEFVHVRPFRFESSLRPEGFAGWSCFMQRPAPKR